MRHRNRAYSYTDSDPDAHSGACADASSHSDADAHPDDGTDPNSDRSPDGHAHNACCRKSLDVEPG